MGFKYFVFPVRKCDWLSQLSFDGFDEVVGVDGAVAEVSEDFAAVEDFVEGDVVFALECSEVEEDVGGEFGGVGAYSWAASGFLAAGWGSGSDFFGWVSFAWAAGVFGFADFGVGAAEFFVFGEGFSDFGVAFVGFAVQGFLVLGIIAEEFSGDGGGGVFHFGEAVECFGSCPGLLGGGVECFVHVVVSGLLVVRIAPLAACGGVWGGVNPPD
jgi:hypothetical protein